MIVKKKVIVKFVLKTNVKTVTNMLLRGSRRNLTIILRELITLALYLFIFFVSIVYLSLIRFKYWPGYQLFNSESVTGLK